MIKKVTILLGVVFMALCMSHVSEAQPANMFGDLTTVGNTVFVDYTMYDRGAFVSTEPIQATVTKLNAKFLYITIPGVYNPKWTGSGVNKVRTKNSKLTGEAYYGQDEMWQEDFEVSVQTGLYYTFLSGKNATANNDMAILETNYAPVFINTVAQFPASTNVTTTDNVVLTVDVTQTVSSGEYIFVRYTTDTWATSQFVIMSQTGATTYSASIPAQTAGTGVSYYILSTITNTPLHADIDFLTLRLLNNGGSNYSYVVQGIAQNSGIVGRNIIFNEGTNYYNDLTQTSFGTWGNTALLTLKGGRLNTWRVSPDDITSARMFYRIYEQGASVLPAFDTIDLPWRADLVVPGHQVWENDTLFELILYPLADGLYSIEAYFEADYSDGTTSSVHVDNNAGSNYFLNFEVDNNITYGTAVFDEMLVIADTAQVVNILSDTWNNLNLGVFIPGDILVLKGAQIKTLKTGIYDIWACRMHYRYYLQGTTPPAFDVVELPWQADLVYNGHQQWGNDSFNLNLISGLTYGTYDFEVYFELDYKKGIVPQLFTETDNNNGLYYTSEFTFSPLVSTDISYKDTEFFLYPNPASGVICVSQNDFKEPFSLRLRDVTGKTLIYKPMFNDNCLYLQPYNLTPGIYFLEAETKGGTFIEKCLIY